MRELVRTNDAVLVSAVGALLDGAGIAHVVLETAGQLLGPERIEDLSHPIMGSEDFSYVLQRVPGALAFLGTRPTPGPAYPNHSNRMLIEESALATGIALHAAVALRVLAGAGGR
jgi:hippurate hydrolase